MDANDTKKASDEAKISVCRQCIHSECQGNTANKCATDELACSIDKENIMDKLTTEPLGDCPRQYWNWITRSGKKSGCGCKG